MADARRVPTEWKEEKRFKENEVHQPSCVEKICTCLEKICCCCCLKSPRPPKAAIQDDVRDNRNLSCGEKSLSDEQRNGGRYMDNLSPKPDAKRSNGEAVRTHDQTSSGSVTEKWLEPKVEAVSSPEAGKELKEKQRSPEPNLLTEQEKGDSPVKISSSEEGHLSKEQQKIYPPIKRPGSPEVSHQLTNDQEEASPPTKTVNSSGEGQLLLKERQKIEPERKTGSSSTEAGQVLSKERQKIEPPRKTVSSTETDQQLSKEQIKGYPPLKTASSSTEAAQLQSKEQQRIDLPRKTVNSPHERQKLSNEQSKGLTNAETGYGSPIVKKLVSPIKTSNSPKQGGPQWSKEQEKDVIREGINRGSNFAESNPAKLTSRSPGKQEEKQNVVLQRGNSSETHTKKNIGKNTYNTSLGQGGQFLSMDEQNGSFKQVGINNDVGNAGQNPKYITKISIVNASIERQKKALKQDDSHETHRDSRLESYKNYY